jgi:Asp-tRNA(Asn)/Glu-tRNA(Gln) amidotransferase A subunit family amidase
MLPLICSTLRHQRVTRTNDDAHATSSSDTMSQQDERDRVSRRRVLQAAASIVPLHVGTRVSAALARLGMPGTTRQSGDDLLALGARDAVAHIRNGDITAEAYVAQLLKHYEAHKDLNVANAIDPARVLEAARAVDRSRGRGRQLGPAAGLPFAVKDQISVAGLPATGGNGALKGYVPKRHAIVVERLVAAGAIPFCKTSLPDMNVVDGLMHQISSHSNSFGAVHNPYDPTRIPGGSSGGNGAILAARIVPAALGLDTNGSIRCPSAFCGVTGLRPSTYTIENAIEGTSRKRYSDDGLVIPPARRLDTIGPMARTVSDVAFLDTLITREAVPAMNLRAARIAVPRPDYWDRDDVDPGVADIVQQALAKLRDAGCTLVEIDLDGEVRSIVGTIFQPTPAAVFAGDGMDAPQPTSLTMAAWLRENAPNVTVEQMYGDRPIRDAKRSLPTAEEQVRALNEAARRYAEVYRSHNVMAIAFPTVPIVATPIRPGGPKEPLGELLTIKGKQIEEGRVVAQNLFMAPRVGAPALSIPAGLSQGLPVGLELDALPGDDSKLLGLGVAIQSVIGRIPPPSFERSQR